MRYARVAGWALFLIGLLLVGRALYDVAGGRIYQEWRGRQLDRALEALPAQPVAAETHRVSFAKGSAIGRLRIPRIGLSVVVLEGSDADTLRLGVGRLTNSSVPGESGNVVLAGHRDTFFRSLRDIRPGDTIALRTPQGSFSYKVDWTRVVDPSDIEVLKPTPAPALTLVTCYPFYYIGSAPQRFIVRAEPANSVAAIPAPPPVVQRKPSPMPVARPAPVRAYSAPVTPVAEVETPALPATPLAPVEDSAGETPIAAPVKPHGIKGAFHKIAGIFHKSKN